MNFKINGFLAVPNRLSLYANSFDQDKVPTGLCPFMRSWFTGAGIITLVTIALSFLLAVLLLFPIGGLILGLSYGVFPTHTLFPIGLTLDLILLAIALVIGLLEWNDNTKKFYRNSFCTKDEVSIFRIIGLRLFNPKLTRHELRSLYEQILSNRIDSKIRSAADSIMAERQLAELKLSAEYIPTPYEEFKLYMSALHGKMCPTINLK